MISSLTASRLFAFILTASIIYCYTFSINRYEVSYKIWQSALTELKLSSYRLDSEIFILRAGIRVDYDQLAKVSGLSNIAINKVKSISESKITSPPIGEMLSSELLFNQQQITLPVTNISQLIQARENLIEDFKSVFSILRNSEMITFQLIKDMRKTASSELRQDLNELERATLRKIELDEEASHNELFMLLRDLNEKYRNSDLTTTQSLKYIVNHINNIMARKFILKTIVEDEQALSKRTKDKIAEIEHELYLVQNTERKRAARYSYIFSLLVLFGFVFTLWQGLKIYRLTKEIKERNANLELKVAERGI